jgi:hypothetical protein
VSRLAEAKFSSGTTRAKLNRILATCTPHKDQFGLPCGRTPGPYPPNVCPKCAHSWGKPWQRTATLEVPIGRPDVVHSPIYGSGRRVEAIFQPPGWLVKIENRAEKDFCKNPPRGVALLHPLLHEQHGLVGSSTSPWRIKTCDSL